MDTDMRDEARFQRREDIFEGNNEAAKDKLLIEMGINDEERPGARLGGNMGALFAWSCAKEAVSKPPIRNAK